MDQTFLGLEFAIDQTGQLKLNLATPPAWLTSILVELPDQAFLFHFGDISPPILPVPMPELIVRFVNYLDLNEDREETTLRGYRQRLGQFAAWLDTHLDLTLAQPGTWLAYYASLKHRQPPYSPYTLKGHFHILSRFARWLVENRYLPGGHPLAGVQTPGLPKGAEPKAIEKKHIDQMLAIARDPRDRALLLFFRDTGCRATEAVELTWGKIKLEEGKTEVLGKGDKARRLFFKALTRLALEKYREVLKQSGPDDPVWRGKRGPLGYDGLYKVFKRLAKEAGLDEGIFSPHAWRHAFGRDTTIAGIPTAQLQELMGHSSIEVTKIYACFNTVELQQAHARYSPVGGDLKLLGGILTEDEDVVE